VFEPDPLVQARGVHALAASLEHRLAEVDSDDVGLGGGGQRDRHPGGAGRDIEDARRIESRDVPDELSPPSRVLTQRQHLGQPVVAWRQAFEQARRKCVLRARHRRHQRTGTHVGLGILPWLTPPTTVFMTC